MPVTELPDDILYTIFPYLTASEFLNFTSSTRALLRVQDTSTYWRPLTLRTFRFPPQPLLEGLRWQWLYKKLLTQTRLYTWGSNASNNLGRVTAFVDAAGRSRRRKSSGWPGQPNDSMQVGIIADVQCGGWCTTILNSIGNVYIFGVIDGPQQGYAATSGRRLAFPPGYPPNTRDRYEPSTAIKQFSTGRSAVLGLSDDGKVWSWTNDTAALIKPLHVDLRGHEVKTVVAGWNRGSIYVQDIGIVYWAPVRDSDFLNGARQENLAVADALLIDTITIPGTGFRRQASSRFSENSLDARIGEVIRFVVLESHIVFVTHLNKVFSYPNTYPMPAIDTTEPTELTTFTDTSLVNQPLQILDLQGSFHNFAVFTSSNQVLTSNNELLDAFHDAQTSEEPSQSPMPHPTLLEMSPQSSPIISLAFGDHHTHALHRNGTVTSWGSEPQNCGALGLGDSGIPGIRGIPDSFTGNTHLPQHRAKTIWFEPLMERWLSDVYKKVGDIRLLNMLDSFGKYYEKEGAKWVASISTSSSSKKDGELGAYFALKVAAGGWSSAALVLVDEEIAERAREEHIIKPAPASAPPSDSGSGAEYEYGDSPFDMVEIALSSIFAWIRGVGRWFLGLTERDARTAAAAAVADADAAQGAGNGEAAGNAVRYTWSDNPVPVEEIRAMRDVG